jgi:hypothetical protein
MTPLYYGLYHSSRYDRVEILNSPKSSLFYSAEIQRSGPQLSIFHPSAQARCDELVALATFRLLSFKINVEMRDGQQLTLQRNGLLSNTHKLKGAKYQWS